MKKRSKRSSKTSTRDKYLQKKYGITLEGYNLMLRDQNDSCAVCKKHKSNFKNSLAVDHNHKTNKVRGLLCYYCNRRLIGRHSLESAMRVFNYLAKYDDNPFGYGIIPHRNRTGIWYTE